MDVEETLRVVPLEGLGRDMATTVTAPVQDLEMAAPSFG
jgi:hypothetical protein